MTHPPLSKRMSAWSSRPRLTCPSGLGFHLNCFLHLILLVLSVNATGTQAQHLYYGAVNNQSYRHRQVACYELDACS